MDFRIRADPESRSVQETNHINLLSCPAGKSCYFFLSFSTPKEKIQLRHTKEKKVIPLPFSSFFGPFFICIEMHHCFPFGHERPTLCHSRQSSLFNQWQRTYSTVILPSIKRNMDAQIDSPPPPTTGLTGHHTVLGSSLKPLCVEPSLFLINSLSSNVSVCIFVFFFLFYMIYDIIQVFCFFPSGCHDFDHFLL